tara:strand:- start:39 stop:458 length:420 start_codon:yes stop_codon:yes gene_type:complete
MLLIHLKKQKVHLRELEILAFSGLTADNRKAVIASFESYTSMVFPGAASKKKDQESFEQKAKRQLAEEARKVYVVRRRDEDKEEAYLKNIARSSDPNVKALAARELKEHARQEARRMNARQRFKGRKERMPKHTGAHDK